MAGLQIYIGKGHLHKGGDYGPDQIKWFPATSPECEAKLPKALEKEQMTKEKGLVLYCTAAE